MKEVVFRTQIDVPKSSVSIGLKDQILTMGSCFSDSIGRRLRHYKFDVLANPYGTIYNPLSIFKLLSAGGINTRGFVNNQGMTFHHDVHSEIRAKDQRTLEKILQDKKSSVDDCLKDANWIIITFGTAWVYQLVSSNHIVANCHKVPQQNFKKRLLGMKEMALKLDEFMERMQVINPKLQLLFTVSPVRHIKDGIAENQLSKSMLRVLCDFAATSYEQAYYFPSYEMLVDDLRDYRYYKEDLIHPTDFAENYIWQKFVKAFMHIDALNFISDWERILSALRHKPFNPDTKEHQKFLKTHIEKLEELSKQVNAEDEVMRFRDQLL